MTTFVIESLFVNDIDVPANRRPVNEEAVSTLAASMAKLGLRTPITIRSHSTEAILVAGAHRLAAAKQLGWDKIDCIVLDCPEEEAEMWEIAENLHRAELTTLERAEQVSRWVELSELVSAQVAPKPQGGRPESGKNRASRELGIDRTEVQRAAKIASLSPEAKEAAKETGLADNQSALLAAAKAEPSRQAEVIRARAVSPPSAYPQDDTERSVKWRRAFERIWNDAPSQDDREWAQEWIERPIMDRRFA